jgi:hypothetical protein
MLVPPMPALKASEQDDDVRVVGSLFHSRSVFRKEWKRAGWFTLFGKIAVHLLFLGRWVGRSD